MVIKAVAVALKQHPKVNSSWLGDRIRYNEHVHIGVAVAVEEGLLVPVVRFADGKPCAPSAPRCATMRSAPRRRKLQPQDWEGNTFTISNLGMFGIEEFTAIINPPDACILAIGGIMEKPVVKNGRHRARPHHEGDPELRPPRGGRRHRRGLPQHLQADAGRAGADAGGGGDLIARCGPLFS
jgi:pyruvate/2-oxoglutarate dehydrogenase complex dihydrolipoamide acyltransferase (E2) component